MIPEWSSSFPYFLLFKSEFGKKGFMIWATVSSRSCFCWLYRASPSLASKNIINLISVLTTWWCPCVESSLVLLEKGIFYGQCVLLAKLCHPLPCFILDSNAKFACDSRYFLTFYFCIPVPYDLKGWESQTTRPASWETYMQVRKQQLELDMEQQTGSK